MLAASACRGQFSSSMPESYSSSEESLAGALKHTHKRQCRVRKTGRGGASQRSKVSLRPFCPTQNRLKGQQRFSFQQETANRGLECLHEAVPVWSHGRQANRDPHLMYLGWDFPNTTSLSSSTAMMSECGTSNMGSRRSFSCLGKKKKTDF